MGRNSKKNKNKAHLASVKSLQAAADVDIHSQVDQDKGKKQENKLQMVDNDSLSLDDM